MTKLRYKSFTWPDNPVSYTVQAQREPVYAQDGSFTGLSPVKRVITGKGVFFGFSAYANFKALEDLLDDGTAGTLIHPVWGTCSAFLTRLTLTQEPKEDYVAYSFTFQTANSSGGIDP